ncbi:MAG TPA: hypothetical protein VEG60_26850 [Candidatus Binatia bacterium]|nr:hypothetical protein [Candidatus Binatia bacterium]
MLYRSGLNFEEKKHSLLQLDYLLPMQFLDTFQRATYLEPERVLMLAVLEDAIDSLQKHAVGVAGKNKKLFDETISWVRTEDDDWLFSFNNVCDTVGLNPGRLRCALLEMAANNRVRRTPSRSAKRFHLTGELRPRQ